MSQILTITLKKLKQVGIDNDIPNISQENAIFLKKLIQERNPKHILEIGTANGYSTLHFASVLPGSSTMTTIEKAWNMHSFAVENLKTCKIKNVFAIWWDARSVIPILADDYFDFIFIDAMKREYLDYLSLALLKMTEDALVVIDDVEKYRDKMENLYTYLDENSIPYVLQKTDSDDSIMLIERKHLPHTLWKITH